MASQVGTQHWLANNYAQILDVDGNYSSAAVVTASAVDMRDYEGIVLICMTSALTGSGMTLLEIVAADNAALTTNVVQVKTSGTVACDAVGDYTVLEASVDEMRHLSDAGGYTSRYMGARLTNDNAGDECVLTVIAYGPKHGPTLNLTAETIA